jgi:AAA+ superfamily predicted ATPase
MKVADVKVSDSIIAKVVLTPGQQRAFDLATAVTRVAPIVLLEGGTGLGKTAVLQRLSETRGGRFLGMTEVLDAIGKRDNPIEVDEAVRELLAISFLESDLVILDDFDTLMLVTRSSQAYPRPYLLEAVLKEAYAQGMAGDKKLVFAIAQAWTSYESIAARAVRLELPAFGVEDYAAILKHFLGKALDLLDVEKIYRFASKLTGHQLSNLCLLLSDKATAGEISTADALKCIEERILTSNLRIEEVDTISFSDLKGAEALIEKLEINVLLPMQQTQKAKKLGLKPKRGVLLHGHPGTGKTSIGRALARQMKGKFFMIDGTFVTEPANAFFKRVKDVFEAAKSNSPSVIFIDDADVLFKTDHVYGLNRYLLTMLDGLESETIGDVCVMLTAMNVKDLPPALLRSGRVELWLETKLPNAPIRQEIILHHAKDLLPSSTALDFRELSKITDGFTPADLRRIIADAKAMLMYDQEKGRDSQEFGRYIMTAAKDLRELKVTVAGALGYELPKSADDSDIVNSCCST